MPDISAHRPARVSLRDKLSRFVCGQSLHEVIEKESGKVLADLLTK